MWNYDCGLNCNCQDGCAYGTVKVLGEDGCGNLILCLTRSRRCWCNGQCVPCRRFR